MHDCENFQTYKQRGEWVELLFMAAAAEHGYHVLKPCGDSLEYDAAVEHSGDLIRVQVKSSSARNGTGYLCQFRRNYLVEEPYSVEAGPLRDVRNSRGCLVPDPSSSNPRSAAQSSRHTMPGKREKKRPLPLRAIPRSLAPAFENPTRAEQVQALETEREPIQTSSAPEARSSKYAPRPRKSGSSIASPVSNEKPAT